jgi:hypothetical protein
MKNKITIQSLLAGLLAIALIASASAADKPNVVLMLSDNMG